jgi:hypothetical protein
VAGCVLARRDLSWTARGAALAVLLAPLAWEPWTGAAAAISGLAVGFPAMAGVLGLLFAAGKLMLIGSAAAPPGMPDRLASLVFFIPLMFVGNRPGLVPLVTLGLVATTVPYLPDVSALAAPLALGVLLLSPASLGLQRAWSGILLATTVLLTSYPWLRSSLVEQILSHEGSLAAAFMLPLLFIVLRTVFDEEHLGRYLRAEAALAAAAFAGLLPFLLPAGTLVTAGRTVLLDASRPVWETSVPPGPVQALVIESSLSNSSPLAPDTTVATVRLVGVGGPGTSWPLRVGQDTGEWAARRADVEKQSLSRPPEPWVSWVAGDFLAQRYRSRHDLPAPERAARLRIERAPGLPADLVIALHGVEVRQ